MRILVTGENGQLGRSIQKLVNTDTKIDNNQNSNDFIFVGREELDLSSKSNISHYFNNNKFDIIINCASYTAVDKAEQEAELANQINHLAVKQLASIANMQQARLIHISTDYVFDGESNKPYIETDIPNSINVYGRTKLAGEKAMQAVMPMNALIIRTSWLYSEYGNNFVSTMLRLSKERDELNVVSDQIGSPTYATDLADAILEIIKNKEFSESDQTTQIYHYSNEGNISWCDFAKEIFKLANVNCKVLPILTKEFVTSADRPKNTSMSKNKIWQELGVETFSWENSLDKFIHLLRTEKYE